MAWNEYIFQQDNLNSSQMRMQPVTFSTCGASIIIQATYHQEESKHCRPARLLQQNLKKIL